MTTLLLIVYRQYRQASDPGHDRHTVVSIAETPQSGNNEVINAASVYTYCLNVQMHLAIAYTRCVSSLAYVLSTFIM